MKAIDVDEILSLGKIEQLEAFNSGKEIIIYGTGRLSQIICELFKEGHFKSKLVAICDGNQEKFGTEWYGFIIKSFEDIISQFPDVKILIASYNYYKEIKNRLIKIISKDRIFPMLPLQVIDIGFIRENRKNIECLYNNLADELSKQVLVNMLCARASTDKSYFIEVCMGDQYFPRDIIGLSDSESFVDAGAFNGDTLLQFVNLTCNKYNSYYAFEPFDIVSQQLEKLKSEILNNDSRIKIFKKGLLDSNKSIGFNTSEEFGSTRIENHATTLVNVVTLDSILDEQVTFIKMDIEGSEMAALLGAKNTILKYKPKLAICVYHYMEDIVSIPEYIMRLGLDYKYYLRHHASDPMHLECETVFYAV